MFWSKRSKFFANDRGTAAIEFALIGPLLILLLAGTLVYGGWLWTAQSVQGLASETARAALGGLDDEEREALARTFAQAAAAETIGIDAARLDVNVESDADAVRVTLSYDAHDHPLMAFDGFVPSPSPIIQRSAVVRTGGY